MLTRAALFRLIFLGIIAAGCEYDARITVNPPDWAADDADALQVVGAAPEGCTAGAPVAIAFALGDDRDRPIAPGDEIEVAAGDHLTVGPDGIAATVRAAALTPVAGGDATSLGDLALGPITWRPADDSALALAVDASSAAAALDPDDDRLVAADAAARAYLGEPERRVAVYAIAGGVSDQRLAPTADVGAATEAIAGIAFAQGGSAPLYDGVIDGAGGVRTASTTGGAVLLVGAALADVGSTAVPGDVTQVLGAAPQVALHVVATADDPTWRDLACLSGGSFLQAASPAELGAAAVAQVRAAAGRWEGSLTLPPAAESLPPGAYRLDGELHVTLGGAERAVPLAVTIDIP